MKFARRSLLLTGGLTLPTVILAALLIALAYRNEHEAVADTLLGTSRALAASLEASVTRWEVMLRVIAASEALTRDDLPALKTIAARALEDEHGAWFVLLRPNGEQLMNTRATATPLPRITLEPGLLPTMQRGELYVSDLRTSRTVGVPVLHLSRPYFRDGVLTYILSVTLLPRNLEAMLGRPRNDEAVSVAVVDRSGTILARNRDPERFVGSKAMPDVVAAAAELRESVWDSTTAEGDHVIAALAPTRHGWAAIVGAPRDHLMSSARQLLLVGVISLGFIAAIAATMARALSRAIDAESKLLEIQDQLRRHATGLEREVEERTHSLRMALSQLEDFSYTVAHDLRAPIRTMASSAAAVLDDHGPALDETSREHLRRILRAGERLERLTTDLLDYCQVGRADVRPEPVATDELVREVIARLVPPGTAAVSVVSPLLPVLGSRPLVEQIVGNLLSNAVKFSRLRLTPEVRIRTERREASVRLWVEDNGVGIPAHLQHKLFRVFERLPQHAAAEGTGVGLAIVRQATERMGGRCGVESDGSTGARFWVELRSA
jgi:signal transduction histidine kinase